jgi:hypothetical protein
MKNRIKNSNLSKDSSRSWTLVIPLLILTFATGCPTLQEAQRRGEVQVIKAAPSSFDSASSTRPDALYLRGGGYSLTRNIGLVKGPTEFAKDAGLARTFYIADALRRNVLNDLQTLIVTGSTNNNAQFEHFSAITNVLEQILSICQQDRFALEKSRKRDRFLELLTSQRDYLIQLESDLEILRSQLRIDGSLDAKNELLPTDLLIQLFDQNLAYGEFTADVPVSGHTNGFFVARLQERTKPEFIRTLNPSWSGDELFDAPSATTGVVATNIAGGGSNQRFYIIDPRAFSRRFHEVVRPDRSGFATDRNPLAQFVDELQLSLFIVDENIFNIVEGLRKNAQTGIFMWDFHHHEVRFYRWEHALERLAKQVEISVNLLDNVTGQTLQILARDEVDSELSAIHSQLRALSRRYSDLTGRAFNKQLVKPADSDAKPLYVTFMLQTLFVKQLGDASSSEPANTKATPTKSAPAAPSPTFGNLLAVCRVKNQNNKAGYYPVIYQENFVAPGFVNVNNRIIWGPVAYTGGFHDIHFGLIKSAEDTSGIKDGFKSLLSTVGAANPEFMAFSPGITALFNAIVDNANKDQNELEVQWTLPAEEARDGSDTDSLIAETGTYIVIKTENSRRPGVEAKAGSKLYQRMLIYSPEHKKLYWRRTFTDPKRNFENPNNEFRDKTYAIFTLVDDYQAPDNIAEILREDLNRVLPQSKVDALIPTPSQHAATVTSLFNTLTNVVGAPVAGAVADTNKLSAWMNSVQRTLWSNADANSKEVMLKFLIDRADGVARTQLGQDLDSWRKARLTIDTNGMITLAHTNTVVGASTGDSSRPQGGTTPPPP